MKSRLPTVLAIVLICIVPSVIFAQSVLSVTTAINYDTLRIMDYNILNYPGSTSSFRNPYFRAVVHSAKPDVLVTLENTTQSGATEFLNSVLNHYQAGLYSTIPFHDGPDTDPHIFFKSAKVTFISASYIPTDLRDIGEYVLKINASSDTIRLYAVHLKASSGSTNEQQRLTEATTLRNYLNNLPAGTKFMVMGDYNFYTSSEPAFIKLTESEGDNDGRLKDPINQLGSWHDGGAFAPYHTQSPRINALSDGGASGGMDDRFDLILTSYSFLDANTIVSSYKAYGNDGNHLNDSINHLPNAAVPDTVANGLYYASDHIPVTCNFKFEKNTGAFALLMPTNSAADQTVSGSLRWQSAANANGYDVYLDQNNPPTTVVSTDQIDTTYSYSGLSMSATYYWKIVAKNGSKKSISTGSPWSFSTVSANAPSSFTLLAPSSGSVAQSLQGTLTWQPSVYALQYDVYLDTVNPPAIRIDSNLSSTEYSYSALSGSKKYYWKIVAKNPNGTITATNAPFNFTTAAAPAAPTNAIASAVTTHSMQIDWTDNASDETGYRVYRSISVSGPFINISNDMPANSTTFIDTGLNVDKRYYYRVVPYSDVGEGSFAAVDAATLAVTPDIPAYDSVKTHSIKLFVHPDTNPASTQYAIRLVHNSDSSFVQTNGLPGPLAAWQTFSSWGGASGMAVNGLDSCSIYYFSVKARNGDGVETDFSPIASAQLPCFVLTQSVESGWNLVSLPLTVSDPRKTTLFPTSTSKAFTYEGMYVSHDSLINGKGYWLKFVSGQTFEFSGNSIISDTIDLIQGWNMIGSISNQIPVTAITTEPAGIIVSDFFGYRNGYNTSNSIQPMKGYWVKAGTGGKLILPSSVLARTSIDRDVKNEELSTASSFTFEDQSGRKQTLFLSDKSSCAGCESGFELPPVPPGGIFDVRFTSQRNVSEFECKKGMQEFPINITSTVYPVKLSWDIQNTDMEIVLMKDNISQALVAKGHLFIDGISNEIKLMVRKISLNPTPEQFALYQNYPNPFNPSTIIKYKVPSTEYVSMKVYDMLGQVVATLVNEVKAPGEYTVQWDASASGGSPNGLYFYRFTAVSPENPSVIFQSVRRMTLLK